MRRKRINYCLHILNFLINYDFFFDLMNGIVLLRAYQGLFLYDFQNENLVIRF